MTDTENLLSLPAGWCWTTIGEICKTTSGGTPSRKKASYYGGKIPWLKSGELNNKIITCAEESVTEEGIRNSSAKIIPKGSLLTALYGATVGKLGILGIDSAINQAICAIFTSPKIYQEYMFWYLYNYRKELLESRKGGAQPNISQQIIREVNIPLPPLPEQHRIVEKIEELFTDLDAGVRELEKAKVQVKNYRHSVLKAAFEGKLVPTEDELAEKEKQNYETAYELLEQVIKIKHKNLENRKNDCSNSHGLDINSLLSLPKGWCWTNLEQLKSFSLYGPRFSSNDYSKEGYLVLRTSDISESGKVDVKSAPKLNLSRETFLKYKVEVGDLLITRSGSLGTLAVFNDKVEAIPGAYLIQYRLVSNSIMSWYIFYFLKSPIGQKRLMSGGAGVGRPNLNAPTIEAIEIPLPPHAEQRRIVSEIERRFSVIDQIEKTIDQSLAQAEKLRQSILKKAFEGKLIPQDPNDEPASVLLERIKKEKGRAENRKKPGKGRKMKAETIMEISGNTKQAELF